MHSFKRKITYKILGPVAVLSLALLAMFLMGNSLDRKEEQAARDMFRLLNFATGAVYFEGMWDQSSQFDPEAAFRQWAAASGEHTAIVAAREDIRKRLGGASQGPEGVIADQVQLQLAIAHAARNLEDSFRSEWNSARRNQSRLTLVRLLVGLVLLIALAAYLTGMVFPLTALIERLWSMGRDEPTRPRSYSDLVTLEEDYSQWAAIRPQAQRAMNIVGSLSEGLLVVSPDGRISMANKAIKQMLGYPDDSLIGMEFRDIYVKLKTVHVQGFFKKKRTFKEEELFKTRDGKVIPVRFSSSFLFDKDMEANGFVCIAKDITKERKVEEELQRQNEWFQVTLSSIGDGVIATDTAGHVAFLNSAAEDLTGWSNEKAQEQPMATVITLLEEESRLPISFKPVTEVSESESLECLLVGAGRKEVPVFCSTAPIKGNDGVIHGRVVVFRDISDLHQAADALRQARDRAEAAARAKDMFLANLSHEIRTPMNGVIGMTGLLLDTDLSREQRESAELVRGSAESLLSLINDMLDFSKIEAGKLELEIIEFDIRATLEEVMDIMAQKAHSKGLELGLEVHHDIPVGLRGDPGRLRQIMLNLINNAVKFTHSGGIYVKVASEREGPTASGSLLRFQIRDTGIGIPPDKLERLFQPFSQVDASMSRKFGGTGLGLAICKQLTEMMDGQIWVTSEEEQGSTFTFTLRFQEAVESSGFLQPPKWRKSRILTNEMSVRQEEIFRYYLGYLGCDMQVGGHDQTSLIGELKDAFGKGNPYDVLMINADFYELDSLIEAVRADVAISGTCIVLLATVPHRKAASQLVPGKADAYLTLPLKVLASRRCLRGMIEKLDTGKANEPQETLEITGDWGSSFGPRRKILVVEDNIVNQKVAVRLLEKRGYRCDVAANGLEALEALHRIRYDLVLMDCQMPEMDGFETTRCIRERESGSRHTPIIAMTANAMKGDRERCLAVGMDDYLAKPVRKKDLFEVLDNYLPMSTG